MKFQTTDSFDSDYRRLKPEHQATFKSVVREKFAPACDAWAAAAKGGQSFVWPASLRVAQLRGTRGIYEMTWSFASPDGRATFEFVVVDDELVCLWRRLGDHDVFRNP